jgi:hypothetical protein
MATKEVQVGDRTVPMPELNGFKAVRAMRLLAEISKCVPDVMATLGKLREDYATQNALIVTPALAKLPRFQRVIVDEDGNEQEVPLFTEADFEAAGGEIRIPQDPTTMDQIIAVFPIVFDAAQDRVVELLALIIAPNSELADADEEGTVDAYLATHGRKLLHAATFDQLVVLIGEAVNIVVDALQRDGGAALERAVGAVTGQPPAPKPEPDPTQTESSTPAFSTESPDPTDGTDEPSSTEPLGASSGNLSTA